MGYATLVAGFLSEAYIDFGDGNYLYISSRMADGASLYKDILSPQPPCHLYLGKTLISIGRVFDDPLLTVRIFSILLHIGTALVIFAIADKLFDCAITALVSAIVYLFMPIGFWWSLGYQSELPEIFFLAVAFYFFITGDRKWRIVLSSIFATAAVFTNMTAVPYVGLNFLYLLVRRRKMFLSYLAPMAVLSLATIGYFETTTGAYLENVFFNQMGTFPPNPFAYAFAKIANEGKDVFTWEGGYIICALIGMLVWMGKKKGDGRGASLSAEYVGWYSLFSILSIIYVSKGATMDYIFTIGEPYVALFAGFFIVFIVRRHVMEAFERRRETKSFLPDTTFLASLCVLILLIVVTGYIGVFFIRSVLHQETYENNELGVQTIKYFIDKHSSEGDTILAPPYYAFLTNRKIIKEYSSTYLWMMKYMNETIDGTPGDGVSTANEIAEAISNKELPIAIINLNTTGKIKPIREALEANYDPIFDRKTAKPYQTLNESLGIYVPKRQ